ncbi:MAG: hypothetical protein QOD84_969 [Acidobacteriaceae bacterium]|jgi:hypothetical protein
MKRKMLGRITATSFALVIVLGAAWQTRAQDAKAQYPAMAPLEQYLIADRDAEIALARSGGPDSVSHDAEVLVLGQHGYETAGKGKNGFACLVQRSWAARPTIASSGIPTCVLRLPQPARRAVLSSTHSQEN